MADLVWFPPMKGCSCKVCVRRRADLKKADRLEAELVNEDKLLREGANKEPW